MILGKYFILALLFTWLTNIAKAQHNETQLICTSGLKRHVSFLAGNKLQGRNMDSEGLEVAADYIREEAKKAGLKPATNNYLQNFKLIATRPDLENSFIKQADSEIILMDSVICMNQLSKKLHLAGNLVFTGFGFQNEEKNYDDLKDADIEGKIAVCAIGSPTGFNSDKPLRWNYRLEYSKVFRLQEKGAVAIIFITNPKDANNTNFYQIISRMNRQRFSVKPDSASAESKIFVTVPEFADKILGKKDAYENYLSGIVKQKKTQTIYKDKLEVEIHTSSVVNEIEAKNIAGMIEGSHPQLKNECVVYMAHYDHLGTDSEGNVFNGADDNASGCAALLEIAGKFNLPEFMPARSILFLWVTGEEKGLLGSGYYAEHPVFPMEKTVACINLDMIGRVYEPRDSVWKKSPKLVKSFDEVYALVSDFDSKLINITDSVSAKVGLKLDKSLPGYFFRSSDHYHFHSRSVPILNLSTGYHADYHKITDKTSRIRFDKMKRVAELSFLIGQKMAGN